MSRKRNGYVGLAIPRGAGEGATIPPASSIANAIYDAVGVRLREAPFTPKRVLASLQKKT